MPGYEGVLGISEREDNTNTCSSYRIELHNYADSPRDELLYFLIPMDG
jgi:hypothetical protein